MSVFELQYVDRNGIHTETMEAWDQEAVVQDFRATHHGERIHLLDVIRLGEVQEV